MYEIEADVGHNRLYATLGGTFDADEAAASAERTIEEAGRLDAGFDVVTDIRDLEASPQEAKEHLQRSKTFLAAHDVATVVRVVGDSPLAEMQFDRTGDQAYEVETAETVEEAEGILNDSDDEK